MLSASSWAQQSALPEDSTQQPPEPGLIDALSDAVAEESGFEDRFDAQVWMVDMSARIDRFITNEQERLEFLRLVHRESRRADVDPQLVLAVIHVESLFDRFALSHAGARGIMQVMPFWKNEIGRPDDNLFDLETNLRYGTTILAYYLDMENGDEVGGLARYNGSYGQTWYPERVFNAYQARYSLSR
ncbi:lytic transglycosylase domain-containing protein [Natronospirillum operosum]|uniref:Lytic transglycosylase domain-containing protein n=1 Tax=Natronospirillum operosum TaxID=2759953 RepID=A0A4Z0WFK3_9GAMM|nr:transglycosylase SLT domain-containing protein [Natronospirillum operosum]TGG93931.1 lytic transglycosylase domain-containing protein [Natronospirillum operosum]